MWAAEGWAARFGVAEERNGLRDTPEQVAAFRPGREVLFGYVDAAQAAGVDRVARIGPERFLESAAYFPGARERPIWESLVSTAMDFAQHTGQVAYLRGLITGMGWR